MTWIQKHVNENPYCILTPSFKDYEKHLLSMEEKYQGKNPGKQDKVSENEATTKLNKPSTAVPSCPVPASGFSFSLASQSSSAEKSEGLTKQMENKGKLLIVVLLVLENFTEETCHMLTNCCFTSGGWCGQKSSYELKCCMH